MRLKQKKFLLLAGVALEKINLELNSPKTHAKDDMQHIKEEIIKMKKSLSTLIFQPSYPLNIVDNWHPKDALGDLLLNLYYDYLELE